MTMLTYLEMSVLTLSVRRRERKASSRFPFVRWWLFIIDKQPPSPLANPRLEALRVFGMAIRIHEGWPGADGIAAFVDAGWDLATAHAAILFVRTEHVASSPPAWRTAPRLELVAEGPRSPERNRQRTFQDPGAQGLSTGVAVGRTRLHGQRSDERRQHRG
jgi:hypothetical protein